jgi:hypothetical protein
MQDMTSARSFDFIKIDIEGAENFILQDEDSIEVMCNAICIFMELHERFVPGVTEVFNTFMRVRGLCFHYSSN